MGMTGRWYESTSQRSRIRDVHGQALPVRLIFGTASGSGNRQRTEKRSAGKGARGQHLNPFWRKPSRAKAWFRCPRQALAANQMQLREGKRRSPLGSLPSQPKLQSLIGLERHSEINRPIGDPQPGSSAPSPCQIRGSSRTRFSGATSRT